MAALDTVVDVMRVPVDGDPLEALVPIRKASPAQVVECDILIVGGGMGGVAAAQAAAAGKHSVCLLEETDWLGGQMTSQGVSAFDEHQHIEAFGGTRSYYSLREGIRKHYRQKATDAPDEPFNPGSCWVSNIAFEPRVGLKQLMAMLSPHVEEGRLQVFLRTKAYALDRDGSRFSTLRAVNLDDGTITEFRFRYVLDATEWGDLLLLGDIGYRIGAETIQETGEAHAQPEKAKAHCVQSCTYTFALERRDEDENHQIEKPPAYDHYREAQPYSLKIHVHGGEIYGETTGWLEYQMFEQAPGTKGGIWTYRRLIDASQFSGAYNGDITMFNWPGIDYRDSPLVEEAPAAQARALQHAKFVSLGFVHWLQTEAPHASGQGAGFPYLRLRPDVMGSEDGVSKMPYIREGRRLRAFKTIVEQDVAIDFQSGARAAHFEGSVGIGWYPIDIHQAGEGEIGTSTRTKPFQIHLGSLIAENAENFLAAGKNIGTTHITNGCYRVHPVEWNIGEVSGTLAAFALDNHQTPGAIWKDAALRRKFQTQLVENGVPICWLIDVPVSDPDFASIQMAFMDGVIETSPDSLEFEPEKEISQSERGAAIAKSLGPNARDPMVAETATRRTLARVLGASQSSQNVKESNDHEKQE